jgi:glutamate decarboxylase
LNTTLTHSTLLIATSAHQLRERGWVVPAYTMAPHSEKMKLMRIVVREDFSKSRCDALISDFKLALQTLDSLDEKKIKEHGEYVLPYKQLYSVC